MYAAWRMKRSSTRRSRNPWEDPWFSRSSRSSWRASDTTFTLSRTAWGICPNSVATSYRLRVTVIPNTFCIFNINVYRAFHTNAIISLQKLRVGHSRDGRSQVSVRPPLPPGLLHQAGRGRQKGADPEERHGRAGVCAGQPFRLPGRRGAVGGLRRAPVGRSLGRRRRRKRRNETRGKDEEWTRIQSLGELALFGRIERVKFSVVVWTE